MLTHKLLLPEGILVLEPSSPLEAADFEAVSQLVHRDVKHFSESEYEDALSWLGSAKTCQGKKILA